MTIENNKPLPRKVIVFANKAIKAESVTEYLSIIKDKCTDAPLALFRGQRNRDWDLLPKVARLHPISGDIQECEKKMLAELKRQIIPYLPNRLDSDLDWLALAQHNGMATRLLDWTTNPLAALWFAVEKPADKTISKGGVATTIPGVVWTFKPKNYNIITNKEDTNVFEGDRTKVFQPDHISPRITAQRGWFTVHKFITQKADGSEGFIALNKNTAHKSNLSRIDIPGECFGQIRRDLVRCGLDSSSIYPGIEGACRHIEEMFTKYSDED